MTLNTWPLMAHKWGLQNFPRSSGLTSIDGWLEIGYKRLGVYCLETGGSKTAKSKERRRSLPEKARTVHEDSHPEAE